MADLSRLPGPIGAVWEWQLRGACRSVGPDTFFHPEGERGPRKIARERAAQQVCERCSVLAQCRRYALQVREPYGVWGGLTEDTRESLHAAARAVQHGAPAA